VTILAPSGLNVALSDVLNSSGFRSRCSYPNAGVSGSRGWLSLAICLPVAASHTVATPNNVLEAVSSSAPSGLNQTPVFGLRKDQSLGMAFNGSSSAAIAAPLAASHKREPPSSDKVTIRSLLGLNTGVCIWVLCPRNTVTPAPVAAFHTRRVLSLVPLVT